MKPISAVTDKVIPLIQDWQQRPLEPVYPIIYLDALHVKVRDGMQCLKQSSLLYHRCVFRWSQRCFKPLYGEAESASYWMSLLDELKARGVQDICIACVDGLSGFKQAIQAVSSSCPRSTLFSSFNPTINEICFLSR